MKLFNYTICCLLLIGNLNANSDNSLAQQTARDFTAVAKKSIPAVVAIRVKAESSNRNPFSEDGDLFGDEIFKFFFGPRRDWGQQQPVVGQASGFIVSPEGHVITNSHVVKNASEILVRLNDGKEMAGKVIGYDQNTDIAVIKINGKNLPYLKFGDSDSQEIGQWTIAIGNPFGLQASLTVGVISAKGRNNLDIANVEDFIQTDAAINRGNSGGPLLNLDGEVVGMNTAIVSNMGTGGYMGIGFAIPSNMIKRVMEQLVSTGSVKRGYVGISLQNIDPDLGQAFGLQQDNGVVVVEVVKGSPGDRAGLQQGDVIQFFNKIPVSNNGALRTTIALTPPGTKVVFMIVRKGKVMEVPVEVGLYPDAKGATAAAAPETINKYGFEVQEMTPELAQNLGITNESGVVISSVDPNSPAAWAGLKKGAVIMAVDQKKISTLDQFNSIVKEKPADKPLLLLIKQGEAVRYLSLKIN